MVEVAHNVTRGKTAVHLDAVVKAVTGSFDDFVADALPIYVDVPSGNRRKVLPEKHGQRIGLLTGGACRAPEAEGAREAAALDQRRQQFSAEQLEWATVAEEAGLVDRHCFGDGPLERGILPDAQVFDKLLKGPQAMVPPEPSQACFKEVVARGIESILRQPADNRAEKAVVNGRRCSDHRATVSRISVRPPWARVEIRRISGAMSWRERMRCANPARATAPGIPQMTLVAWSCASTVPPCARIRREPASPSEPMPVSTTASRLDP